MDNPHNETAVRAEAFDWLMRVEAASGEAGVRADFDAWLAADEAHRSAYRSVERMWRLSAALPRDYMEQVGVSDGSALAHLCDDPRSGRHGTRAAALIVLAVAACLAMALIPAVQLWLHADYLTGTAELRSITLDDGSVVRLDADSAIAVHYGERHREVALLAGQAFFDVAHAVERPFVVTVADVTVTDTGTAFGVRSSAETVSVAVQSGSVEVALDRGNRPVATLERGEQVTVNRAAGQVVKSAIAPETIASWRNRRLVVDGVPLAEVVEELGRHYFGAIVLRDRTLAARHVTGVFDLAQPVEALQALVRTQQATMTEYTPYLLVVSGR